MQTQVSVPCGLSSLRYLSSWPFRDPDSLVATGEGERSGKSLGSYPGRFHAGHGQGSTSHPWRTELQFDDVPSNLLPLHASLKPNDMGQGSSSLPLFIRKHTSTCTI